jgi:hypothetical protein
MLRSVLREMARIRNGGFQMIGGESEN